MKKIFFTTAATLLLLAGVNRKGCPTQLRRRVPPMRSRQH